MQKKGEAIDRDNGVQIAQRTGARMLLLPMVSESGGKVRVDLEVVDPVNSATVLSLGASGRDTDSAIRSTGNVAESLRARLGESTSVIAGSSLPLEQVTTGNIEALRAFHAAGVRTFAVIQPVLPMNVDRLVERIAPFVRVVRLDRMYVGERVRHLYEGHGLQKFATEAYADETIARLTHAFRSRGVAVDPLNELEPLLDA